MLKQTFVVTLEIPSPFDRYFPTVEAGRVANIIRDGIEAKSVSFIGPAEFTISVGQGGEVASASGQVRQYKPEEFPEIEEAVHNRPEAREAVPGKRLA